MEECITIACQILNLVNPLLKREEIKLPFASDFEVEFNREMLLESYEKKK